MSDTNNDIRVLTIPKWGLSMEEGTIVEWLIAVGDEFSEGQEICEIETSKIVNVLEAPFPGTLRKILAQPEETLPVQAPIAVCASVDVSNEEVESYASQLSVPTAVESAGVHVAYSQTADQGVPLSAGNARNRPNSLRTVPGSNSVDIPSALQSGNDDSNVHATPRARALAERHGINLNQVVGTGRNGRISVEDIQVAVASAGGRLPDKTQYVLASVAPAQSVGDDASVSATPLARRAALSLGVNLRDCIPSGRNGRVTRRDVENAHRLIRGPLVADETPTSPQIEPLPKTSHDFDDASLSGMRKVIASRMSQSKQSAPHFRLTLDCEIDALLKLRSQINSENPAAKVSVNDFIVKSAAMALMEVPECNVQFNGETVRTFKDAHVSVAVALEAGLITPIVPAANKKGLVEVSNETKSLTTRAKANTLKPENIQGGTFTVSNLGMFGIRQFDAIINPPQTAILAVGIGSPQVVVVDGKPEVRNIISCTLCCDHRIIDGALGARWLAAFKEFVEKPARLLS